MSGFVAIGSMIRRLPVAPIPEPTHDPAIPWGRCADCGEDMPPRWIPRLGAWVAPEERCSTCRDIAARRERDEAHRKRLHRANIPERYRGYSWTTAVTQGDDELEVDLRARLTYEGPILGITARMWEVCSQLQQWTPRDGSVLLEGDPGSGKTLLACVMLSALLREEPGIAYQYDEAGRCRGGRPTGQASGYLTSEAELVAATRRRRAKLSDEERSTLDVARTIGVLVLDDLGSQDSGGSSLVADVVEEVVDARYRRLLPCIFTSNTGLPGIEARLGRRVASRIGEMTEGRRFRVVGDWRSR